MSISVGPYKKYGDRYPTSDALVRVLVFLDGVRRFPRSLEVGESPRRDIFPTLPFWSRVLDG